MILLDNLPDDSPEPCRASYRRNIRDNIVRFLPAASGCSGFQRRG